MSQTNQLQLCDRCGAVLSGYGAERLCAACLLESALLEPTTPAGARASAPPLLAFNDYELLEEIARGGMGVVYRARQIGLNRPVAVKMILGGHLANAAEMQRFRAEAETAAQLHHPNIVAIHEVGEHEGQPFFSMELVAGRNLAQVVRDEPLPSRKAAAYLKTISEAVQYAHSRGVLHRDLKPSNILIDENDQPRITDFGLAKRLEGDASLTITGQVLGSPSFIPPEQAAGRKDEIGPPSDVYSLGAILYHLLTGRPPFVAETLPQTLRMVTESEPVSPRLLNASVPRDLETISLKCLEKDPRRRYGTARELAEELERFLRDEPILARPIGAAARLMRWCRRNPRLARTATAALLLFIIVLIGGPIAILQINQSRKRAEIGQKQALLEATKSRQVAELLKEMLRGVAPSVALGRDTTLMREILDKTVENMSLELTNQPLVEAELQDTIGRVYVELGEFSKAEAIHRKELATHRKLLGNEHLDVANSLTRLAIALNGQERFEEGEKSVREALAIQKKQLGEKHLDVAHSLRTLAMHLSNQGKRDEAEKLVRQALEIHQKLGDRHEIAQTLGSLAHLVMEKDLVEAERMFRDVIATYKELHGDAYPDSVHELDDLGIVLSRQGKFGEAEKIARESLDLRMKMLGVSHPHLTRSLYVLGVALDKQGKVEEGNAVFRTHLTLLENAQKTNSLTYAEVLSDLANRLADQKKYDDAEALGRRALEIQQRLASNNVSSDRPLNLAKSLHSLAYILQAEDKLTEAEDLYRQELVILRKRLGDDDLDIAEALRGVAWMLQRRGNLPAAESFIREALAIGRKLLDPKDPGVAEVVRDLQGVLLQQGKLDDVELSNLDDPDFLGRFGRWKEATARYRQRIESAPDDFRPYLRLAPILLLNGDMDGYRRLCQQCVNQFSGTTNVGAADMVAKVCSLDPRAGVKLDTVADAAETAVTLGKDSELFLWFGLCKSMAEYRQRHFAGATNWAQKSLASAGPVPERDAAAYLVLAMAQTELKQTTAARDSFEKGCDIVERRLPRLDSGDLGNLWHDGLIARLLLREARTRIEENSEPVTDPAHTARP
jgi:tetratricopeptide (TPR) repeat protein